MAGKKPANTVKRLSPDRKGYPSMAAAILAAVPSAAELTALGMNQKSIVRMALDTPSYLPGGTWYGAPFGSSKMSPAKDRRAARKRKAVKRARRLGHA